MKSFDLKADELWSAQKENVFNFSSSRNFPQQKVSDKDTNSRQQKRLKLEVTNSHDYHHHQQQQRHAHVDVKGSLGHQCRHHCWETKAHGSYEPTLGLHTVQGSGMNQRPIVTDTTPSFSVRERCDSNVRTLSESQCQVKHSDRVRRRTLHLHGECSEFDTITSSDTLHAAERSPENWVGHSDLDKSRPGISCENSAAFDANMLEDPERWRLGYPCSGDFGATFGNLYTDFSCSHYSLLSPWNSGKAFFPPKTFGSNKI